MSTGLKHNLYVILDGRILELHLDSAKSHRNALNKILDYDPKAVVWSVDAWESWFFDTMAETKSLVHKVEIPNWLKMYLLIGA